MAMLEDNYKALSLNIYERIENNEKTSFILASVSFAYRHICDIILSFIKTLDQTHQQLVNGQLQLMAMLASLGLEQYLLECIDKIIYLASDCVKSIKLTSK